MDGSSRRGRLIVDPSAMAGNRAKACGGCQTKRKRFPTVTRLGDAYSLRVGRFPWVQSIQPAGSRGPRAFASLPVPDIRQRRGNNDRAR